jgi:hypothetical protein
MSGSDIPSRGPTGPGPYMAQNPGIRDAAFQVLTRASGNRNVKLRHVAAAVVASIAGETDIPTHFSE